MHCISKPLCVALVLLGVTELFAELPGQRWVEDRIPSGFVIVDSAKGESPFTRRYLIQKPTDNLWLLDESECPKGYVPVDSKRVNPGKTMYKIQKVKGRSELWMLRDNAVPDGYEVVQTKGDKMLIRRHPSK